ncbi:MAG: hypothetical protein ISP83_00470 [Candidatus Poseidonia sp.]|nr:hypothetical protein [Poseidonia sp.]MBL6748840.1 hypothetical protein [Poseidonia sp.]MBL6805961.1 hypothetical protein [Poseidonia sp.]MBL6892041.1 hypothetical protein [Poseidonia sp.]
MVWMETIVCSGKKGSDARLRRMIKARLEYKRRQDGCIGAWIGRGAEDGTLLLVQSAFTSAQAWKRISSEIKETLDAQDGGIETLLLGPPLVGIFEIDETDFSILD